MPPRGRSRFRFYPPRGGCEGLRLYSSTFLFSTHATRRAVLDLDHRYHDVGVALQTKVVRYLGLNRGVSLEIIKFNDYRQTRWSLSHRRVVRHARLRTANRAIKNPHSRGARAHSTGSERKTIYYLSVRRVPDYAASAGTVTSAAITAFFFFS